MQKHVRTRSRVSQLPEVNPKQLPLPGVEPAPVTRRFLLPEWVRESAGNHRYSIGSVAGIGFLYLLGQGTVATGLLFAIGLYQINQFIDSRMSGGES